MSGVASSVGPNPAYLSAVLAEEYTVVRTMDRIELLPNAIELIGGSWELSIQWYDGSQAGGTWLNHEANNHWRPITGLRSAPITVDVDMVFSAMDRALYPSTGALEEATRMERIPWDQLPGPILDQIVGGMDLTDIFCLMKTCRNFFDHVTHCYPLWSRVAGLLKPLAHDAAHLIPTNLDRPASELFHRSSLVLKELHPASNMKYFLDSSLPTQRVHINGHVRRFKIFPETDLIGVLCSSAGLAVEMQQWLLIFPLSRLGNGDQIATIELQYDWFVKDFFVQKRFIVVRVSGRGDWQGAYPALLSIPLETAADRTWEPVVYLDNRTELLQVAVNSYYMAAVVLSYPRIYKLFVWPIKEDGSTFTVRPTILPLHHFVVGVSLYQTQLALLRLPRFYNHDGRVFCCMEHGTRSRFPGEAERGNQSVMLEMRDLGHPSVFAGPLPSAPEHVALHEADGAILGKLCSLSTPGLTGAIQLIDPRSPYFRSHVPNATFSHTDEAGEVFVSSGPDHLRVGSFVVSQTSVGQFYRLVKRDPSATGIQLPYLILNVKEGGRAVVDTVTMVSYLGQHYFAGRNLIYCDGSTLKLRQLPSV